MQRLLSLILAALVAAPALAQSPDKPIKQADAAAPRHTFTVEIANGRVKGDGTLKARQGEQVELRISSDQPIELHLHGYEVTTKVNPPAVALMAFKANVPGRFPVHEHRTGAGNHRALLFIEVHP